MPAPKNLLGQRFGFGTVIEFLGHRQKASNRRSCRNWKLQCDCGNTYECISEYLTTGQTKSCGCHKKKFHNTPPSSISPHINRFPRYFSEMKGWAKKRGKAFHITKDDAMNQFIKQDGKCALTGVEISINEQTASLDRINSDLPYTPDNIQWVHRTINFMKNTLPQDTFIFWCKHVSHHFSEVSSEPFEPQI